MAGRTVLVTGGTGGIGGATAAGLAALGARVGIVGRDRARAEAAAATIRARRRRGRRVRRRPVRPGARCGGWPPRCWRRTRASTCWSTTSAATGRTRHVTADGLERTFALNHLAPFLLTNLLLDRLRASAPARVVTVSSDAQAMGRIDFDDLQGERCYSGQRAYNQSKLANVLFTYELARRLEGTGRHRQRAAPGRGPHRLRRRGPAAAGCGSCSPSSRPFMKTPEQGAATSIHLASAPELEGVTGRYFANGRREATPPRRPTTRPRRPGSGDVSAELVGLAPSDVA